MAENDKQGAIALVKQGEILGETSPLANVTFRLYRAESGDAETDCVEANYVKEATTNSNGQLSMANLDAGTYWLKETSVDKSGTQNQDNGFVPGLTVQVTVVAGATTTTFVDPAQPGSEQTILKNTTT